MTEWTVATLLEHFQALRAADLEALQAALATAEKAVLVADGESKDRLASHNGLIRQMRDREAEFASQRGLDDFKESVDRRIGAVEKFQAKITGGLILVGAIGVANLVKVWAK